MPPTTPPSEAPTMPPTIPPFRPHHVRLTGHRDLGIVQARWLGCILELEDGTRHGPCAVFEAVPVVEAVPVAAPVVDPAPVPPVERLRYEGKPVRWVDAGAGFQVLRADPRDDVLDHLATVSRAGRWSAYRGYAPKLLASGTAPTLAEARTAAIRALLDAAYLTVEPEPPPKDRTVYDPDDIRPGDVHHLSDGTHGRVLGVIDGWIAYVDRLPGGQHGGGVVRVKPFDPDEIPF